jgi:hypothetical protein
VKGHDHGDRALAANGGIRDTESFFRYFLAPGVMHCGTPGPGSIAPTNPTVASSYTCSRRSQFTNPFVLNGQR